jgi:hypothetical protein
MSFDPTTKVDLSQPGAFDELVAELRRECALRKGAYAKWADEGKYPADKLNRQYGLLVAAGQLLSWMNKTGTARIKLGLALIGYFEANPHVFAQLVGDETLKKVVEAFPEATIKITKPGEHGDLSEAA